LQFLKLQEWEKDVSHQQFARRLSAHPAHCPQSLHVGDHRVNPDPYNPIVRFLHNVTEPVLYAIRRRVPIFFGGIDFSPMLVILAILFLDSFLVPSLVQTAQRMVM